MKSNLNVYAQKVWLWSFWELSWFLYNAEPFKNQVVFMGSYFEGEVKSLKNI